MKVDFYRHHLGEREFASVKETLQSAFLTAGPRTAEFEEKFARYLGVHHALGLTSCTAGLFLALKALGVGEGDEVIVPAMTFMASSNVVLHCGAKPVFVDVEPDTGLIDVKLAERAITERTRVIMPVHLYGHLADMRALRALADRHGLRLVEDAAHAVESRRDGVNTGQLGECAAFSFYATKNLTSGEGGAVTAATPELHEKLRLLRQHGMSKSASERYQGKYVHYEMLDLGYKYNMFDIQAALLLPQLDSIESLLARREVICQQYEAGFRQAGIEFPIVRPGARSARHLFTVWAPHGKRDRMLKGLQEREIGVAVNYRPVHLLEYYRKNFAFKPGDFSVSEEIGERTITLPLYPKLTEDEIGYVIQSVIDVYRSL